MSMQTALFNLHDMILIMTAAFSVLLALPLLLRRGGLPQDRLLAQFILVQGLLAAYYLLLYADFSRPTTVALTLPYQVVPIAVCFAAQGPLLYWFSQSVAGVARTGHRRALIVFASVVALPMLLRFVSGVDRDYGPKYDGIFLTLPALTASIAYGIGAMRTVYLHEQWIEERYSNLEAVNLVWLGYVALGFVGVWLIRLVHYLLGMSGQHDLEQAMALASNLPPLLLIAALVTLGLGRSRGVSLVEEARAPDQPSERSDSNPSPELIARLDNLMCNVRVYEDPNLDREGLADSLGVSPRTLSACVNGHFDQTFYEYVNGFRIDAAKRALRDPDKVQQSIQRVFEEAGFNSKSTFNTLFKKSTGVTPSQYRQKHLRAG